MKNRVIVKILRQECLGQDICSIFSVPVFWLLLSTDLHCLFYNTLSGMWHIWYQKQCFGLVCFSPCPILCALLVGEIVKISLAPLKNKNIINISSLDRELPPKFLGCQFNQGKDQIVDHISFSGCCSWLVYFKAYFSMFGEFCHIISVSLIRTHIQIFLSLWEELYPLRMAWKKLPVVSVLEIKKVSAVHCYFYVIQYTF